MPFNPQTGSISTIGATSNKVYSPKFFDSKLTGRGGTSNVGLLSAKNNPISVPDSIETLYNHYTLSRKVIRNGNITRKTENNISQQERKHPSPDASAPSFILYKLASFHSSETNRAS